MTGLKGTGQIGFAKPPKLVEKNCRKKLGEFRERIQIIHFCHFCIILFAMLADVNCVKFSSKNGTQKVNIKPNKHYVGKRLNSAASVSYCGATMTRLLTMQSYQSKKFKIALLRNQRRTLTSKTMIDRAIRFSPNKATKLKIILADFHCILKVRNCRKTITNFLRSRKQ